MNTLTIKHANAKITGSQLVLSLIPGEGMQFGIHKQASAGEFFDGFSGFFACNVSHFGEILQLFRGETESLNYGRGIIHGLSTLRLSHHIDPVCGYLLEIDSGNVHDTFFMTPSEALVVCEAITGVLHRIFFNV